MRTRRCDLVSIREEPTVERWVSISLDYLGHLGNKEISVQNPGFFEVHRHVRKTSRIFRTIEVAVNGF